MKTNTFVNSLGQTVRIPNFFNNAEYGVSLKMAAGLQTTLTAVSTDMSMDLLSGRPFNPRVRGILPAVTEVIYRLLKENQRKISMADYVYICVDDVIHMYEVLGIIDLINVSTLRQYFSKFVNRQRDYVGRQISVPVYELLNCNDFVTKKIPQYGRGGPRIGYRFR